MNSAYEKQKARVGTLSARLMGRHDDEPADVAPTNVERMTYGEFADAIGATRGSVARWVHEGMPVDRSLGDRSPVVMVVDALKWLNSKQSRPSSRGRKSFVYFAQRDDVAVKIGFTSDVERRVHELGKGKASRPTLLAMFPGDKRTEGHVHAMFAAERIGGEWFRPSDALIGFIALLSLSAA